MVLISTAEAARRAGVSQAQIRDLMTRRVLDGRKIGNRWGVDEGHLAAYLQKERDDAVRDGSDIPAWLRAPTTSTGPTPERQDTTHRTGRRVRVARPQAIE
jgi:hypothetical protein